MIPTVISSSSMPFDTITFWLLALFAGSLTALAPCILPVLPIILGSSIGQWYQSSVRIIASLLISVGLSTLLLKTLSVTADIDPSVWSLISGGILITIGLTYVFPRSWTYLSEKLKMQESADTLLMSTQAYSGYKRDILTWLSLGPVFSACSPTYSILLATVFPSSWILGWVYLALYLLGLWGILLSIVFFGGKWIRNIRWITAKSGVSWLLIGLLLISFGVFIATGLDKKLQIFLLDVWVPNVTTIETKLIAKITETPTKNQTPEMIKNEKQPAPWESIDTNISWSVQTPYRAPDLSAIQDWINANPGDMKNLEGKVVLIDFWTYSCINCQRTLPTLTSWDQKYRDEGLVIIGIHAPEFAFEKKRANVEKAVEKANIKYAVWLDNNFDVWDAYDNLYWPAKYFIDKNGFVRHTHFGEGGERESEQVIQALLNERNPAKTPVMKPQEDTSTPKINEKNINPETYLGAARAEWYQWSPRHTDGTYVFRPELPLSGFGWTLSGSWDVRWEYIEAKDQNASITLQNHAKQVYLVISRNPETPRGYIEVTYQGKIYQLDILEDQMYTLLVGENRSIAAGWSPIQVTSSPGLRLHAFTFWSE